MCLGLLITISHLMLFRAETETMMGVVVEEVQPGGAGAVAGLEPGDVLLSWSRETETKETKSSGDLTSPLDLRAVAVEQVPRGATRLEGKKRDGKPLCAELPPIGLEITVRPNLPKPDLETYEQGKALIKQGKWSEGVALWSDMISAQEDRPEKAPVKLWLFQEIAETYAAEKQWLQFDEVFDQALAGIRTEDAGPRTQLLERRGEINLNANRFEEARKNLSVALALSRSVSADSLATADLLYRLGDLSRVPGDYDEALTYYQESSLISKRVASTSTSHVEKLNKLGLLYCNIGDFRVAADYLDKANRITAEYAPGSREFGLNLFLQGYLALEKESLDEAQQKLDQALATFREVDTDQRYVPWVLNLQARLARKRGNFGLAEDLCSEALNRFRKTSPGGFGEAMAFSELARCAKGRRQLPQAAELFQRALDDYITIAPNNLHTSLVRYELGTVYRDLGRKQESLSLFEDAYRAIEAKVDELINVAEETKALYSARFRQYYRDNIDLLVGMDEPERAFQVLESYHARVFLKQLTDRQIARSQQVTGDLSQRRRALDKKFEEIQLAFSHPESIENPAEREELWVEMSNLLGQRAQLLNRMKQESPHQKAYPAPLDFQAARASLEPGTALISYMVHDQRSLVFVVRPNHPCKVYRLPLDSNALSEKIQDFRLFLTKPGSSRATAMMVASGRELYDLLVKPFVKDMGAVERLLIVPDGPLWTLPFSALVTSTEKGPRYLIEDYPITLVNSGTAYKILEQGEKKQAAGHQPHFVAFGAPLYPHLNVLPNTQSLSRFGQVSRWQEDTVTSGQVAAIEPEPLPFSKPEAEELIENYCPEGQLFLGAQANETNAKALDESADVIHFSCHGILDENYPQNSSLVLSSDGSTASEVGLLHAWEISELKLDAALVVLSSCESGLGHPLNGEGVLGLTRAFQYAGARSVVNTLWRVSDLSSYWLMKAFYHQLMSGYGKDEALRLAQLNILRHEQKKVRHPYYWAAFQLHGIATPVSQPVKGAASNTPLLLSSP